MPEISKKHLLFIFCCMILATAAGCSGNEERISIQKRVSKSNYKFEAYKENVKQEKTAKLKALLNQDDWQDHQQDGDKEPTYIFYFNDEKEEGKIPVYDVWLNRDSETAELARNHSEYMSLNEQETTILLKVIEKEE